MEALKERCTLSIGRRPSWLVKTLNLTFRINLMNTLEPPKRRDGIFD
jgi:hypothetical protein